MKQLTIAVFLLCSSYLNAQLYDRTWVCGNYGGNVVFNGSQIDTAHYFPYLNCYADWACISSKSGEFQFFTEGINVYSYNGTPMDGGNQMADAAVNSNFPSGLPDFQNVVILPKKEDQYYVIYQSASDNLFNSQGWSHTDRLYYSVVDMSLNFGLGQVVEKRNNLNLGAFCDGHLTACQHANGRDWWLVQRGYHNNRYLIYLITPDSISLKNEQFIGSASGEPDAVGQSVFSPNGLLYATVTGNSPLILLDFDRCSGLFSNPRSIQIPSDTLTFYGQLVSFGGGGNGICFSPTSRFLYLNSHFLLRQYDLDQTPIDSSAKTIFLWTDSNEYLGQFNQMHLGPDGKIYIANFQGLTTALHVIEKPDSLGLASSFVKWGLPIATNNAMALSNMVHYRMGPLAGSVCDTLSGIVQQGEMSKLVIQPNPTVDNVTVSIPSYLKGAQINIADASGKTILHEPFYLTHWYSCLSWPAGTYFVSVSNGSKSYLGKIIKQ